MTTIGETSPEVVDSVAVARLYGEPLFQLPQDLYIPPEALEIFLEAFEGPLDLLLYLIRRQNFDLFDIPLAELTAQYLSYIEQIKRQNLDLAAEYLLMAATLIEMKSRLLLPKLVRSEEDAEIEDPRVELAKKLLLYEQFKLAARKLDALPLLGRDFWQSCADKPTSSHLHQPMVSIKELFQAWSNLDQRSNLTQLHRIASEELSVREFMSHVLRVLQGKPFIEFEQILQEPMDHPKKVVTFLAVLELAKECLVSLTQAQAYSPLYIELTYQKRGSTM